MVSPDSGAGYMNHSPHFSAGDMSRDLWTGFKSSTVCSLVKNYLYYSDFKMHFPLSFQDALKSHPLMASGSGLWSRTSSSTVHMQILNKSSFNLETREHWIFKKAGYLPHIPSTQWWYRDGIPSRHFIPEMGNGRYLSLWPSVFAAKQPS